MAESMQKIPRFKAGGSLFRRASGSTAGGQRWFLERWDATWFVFLNCLSIWSYGYGSIPIDTIFRGMNIHKSQLFWCELQGTRFWHTAISSLLKSIVFLILILMQNEIIWSEARSSDLNLDAFCFEAVFVSILVGLVGLSICWSTR